MDTPAAAPTAPETLQSELLAVEHGFTTRRGGVSGGPYDSLNLGLSSGDDRATVERNRDLLLASLGLTRSAVCAFDQVHGVRVLVGRPTWFEEEADAAISDDPDLLVVVSAADCFPVLFHDTTGGAVGAAHCGWRGAAGRLPETVVRAMTATYGTAPEDLHVAVGPGIRGTCYEVSDDVARRFVAAGLGACLVRPAQGERAGTAPGAGHVGGWLLDIEAAIRQSLRAAGVAPERIDVMGRCTHCEPELFYSHRRDAGRTGRSWAFVRATARGAA